MDTTQIKKILEKDKYTRDIFRGVFAANTLPKTVQSFPSLFIVNTAPSSEDGEHWCLLYFTSSKNLEFFESYGNPPDMFKFNEFAEKNSRMISYNSLQLQGDKSWTCGGYSIYFSLNRCRGVKMFDIISRFSKNAISNDNMIKEFMYKNFSIKL